MEKPTHMEYAEMTFNNQNNTHNTHGYCADIQVIKSIVSKLDETLEKLTETSISVSKILAVHEGKIQNLEKHNDESKIVIKEIYTKMEKNLKELVDEMKSMELNIEDKIDKSNKQSSNQHESLLSKVDKLDERIEKLENWRWYIVGCFVVIGYIISNHEFVAKLLH